MDGPTERGVDFPAAHSMDTDWFAVDADGHVAYFSSGSSGAVPRDAPDEDGAAFDARRLLPGLRPSLPFVCDTEGFRDPFQLHASRGRRPNPKITHTGSILMFLKDRADLEVPVERADAESLDATSGFALNVIATGAGMEMLRGGVPIAAFRAIHERDACLGCGLPASLFRHSPELLGFELPNPASHGVFVFEHLYGDAIAGAYGRQLIPREPIRIDAFPGALRKIVRRVELPDFCFAEIGSLQPAHHLACRFWEPYYLCIDGKSMGSTQAWEWIARDRDGHVALFRSSSWLDLPLALRDESERFHSGRPRVLAALPFPQPFALDGGDLHAGEGESHLGLAFGDGYRTLPALVYRLRPGHARPAGRAIPLVGGGDAVIATLTNEESRELHRRGACQGCRIPSSVIHPAEAANRAEAGLYVYEQLEGAWEAGATERAHVAFGRLLVPLAPMLDDEVHPELEGAVEVRFDEICFAETSLVEPWRSGVLEW